METQEYLSEMKMIQNNILAFFENSGELSDNYGNDLTTLLDSESIKHHPHKIKSVLYLLCKISNSHRRAFNLISKTEQILEKLRHRIKHFFEDIEIFNIFKGNKRILIFLIEKNFITVNQTIANIMLSDQYQAAKYPQYFFNEIKPFISQPLIDELSQNIPDDFEEKRKNGENDDYLCEIIRNDFIHEFTNYTKKMNIPLDSTIKPSIYETNNFLMRNEETTTLIEYAAFFGSVQIFKYIYPNIAKLKSKLWLYVIHGQSAEIIYFLRDNHFKVDHKNFGFYVNESVKCHHIEIANYVQENFIDKTKYSQVDLSGMALKYYNFYFITNNFKIPSVFYHLCKYDYYHIVHILIRKKYVLSSREKTQNTIFIST